VVGFFLLFFGLLYSWKAVFNVVAGLRYSQDAKFNVGVACVTLRKISVMQEEKTDRKTGVYQLLRGIQP